MKKKFRIKTRLKPNYKPLKKLTYVMAHVAPDTVNWPILLLGAILGGSEKMLGTDGPSSFP